MFVQNVILIGLRAFKYEDHSIIIGNTVINQKVFIVET
jgi:hypothetical protein